MVVLNIYITENRHPVTFFNYLRLIRETFLMKLKIFAKLFIFSLLVTASFALISYTHTKSPSSADKECSGKKCCQQKVQTEFILWESISRNLFGNNS